MGLLAPTEGRVLVDDTDIRALGVSTYRHRIAGVLQDDGLFAGSIAENICGFDAHPDRKKAWAAFMSRCSLSMASIRFPSRSTAR
jgi:ABC-type multidrug transport system fused ATPase/permease subunit